MSRRASKNESAVSSFYNTFERHLSDTRGENDAAPLFETGSSNEMGITKIRIEQVEPKHLAGFRGNLDWRASEEDILVQYGPGVYSLSAFQGTRLVDTISCTIQGDRDEWEQVRRQFMPGGSNKDQQQNQQMLKIMQELMQQQQAQQKEMMQQQQQQQAQISEMMVNLQQQSAKAQIQVATDMASMQRAQGQHDLERLELQIARENKRHQMEMELMQKRHEQDLEREARRRKDEIELERDRMRADQQREREFNAMLFKTQEEKGDKTIALLEAAKTLFGGGKDEDDFDWKKLLVDMAPKLLESMGPGQQQEVMQVLAAQQQQTQQAQIEAQQVAQQAQQAQIEAQKQIESAKKAQQASLMNPSGGGAPQKG